MMKELLTGYFCPNRENENMSSCSNESPRCTDMKDVRALSDEILDLIPAVHLNLGSRQSVKLVPSRKETIYFFFCSSQFFSEVSRLLAHLFVEIRSCKNCLDALHLSFGANDLFFYCFKLLRLFPCQPVRPFLRALRRRCRTILRCGGARTIVPKHRPAWRFSFQDNSRNRLR